MVSFFLLYYFDNIFSDDFVKPQPAEFHKWTFPHSIFRTVHYHFKGD